MGGLIVLVILLVAAFFVFRVVHSRRASVSEASSSVPTGESLDRESARVKRNSDEFAESIAPQEEELIQRANSGDSHAAAALGQLARSRGDNKEAIKWMTQSAEAGNTAAMCLIGMMLGKSGDAEGALKWVQLGADSGDEAAKEFLKLAEGRSAAEIQQMCSMVP